METKIQRTIALFIDDIMAITRASAISAIEENMGGGAKVAKAPPKAGKSKPMPRVRRSPEALERIGSMFLAHVKSFPGLRLEEIGLALSIKTGVLKRPVTMLLAAKKLRTTGDRRGTKYFATRRVR